jgi:hypothetical protein
MVPNSGGADTRGSMGCPTAKLLFDNYNDAALEFSRITEQLSCLVGQHEQFQDFVRQNNQAFEKCLLARFALERHWAKHNCRVQAAGLT